MLKSGFRWKALTVWVVSNNILLGLILAVFGIIIFSDWTPRHNNLAKNSFGQRLVANYEGGHPQVFITSYYIDSTFLE